MKVRRHLTYANVMSTIAVFGVLAGGSAYAVRTIGPQDIKRNAVTGKHIRNGTVRGVDVNERTLDARGFSVIDATEGLTCDPSDAVEYEVCATAALELHRRGRVLVVATGANYSESASPASGNCRISTNGQDGASQTVGELTANTSATATNGFARTLVTDDLSPGPLEVRLTCNEITGDLRVQAPTIAAIALTNGRR